MEERYGDRDRRRGIDRTFGWFVEEVGELSRALRRGSRENLEHEFSDAVAWLASLANQADVDLAEGARALPRRLPALRGRPVRMPLRGMRAGNATIAPRMRPAAATLTLVLLGALAFAQDGEEAAPPEQPAETTEETEQPAAVEFAFLDDYAEALAKAKAETRLLLVVAVPDWYDSPVWQAIRKESLDTSEGQDHLKDFVAVLEPESRDREVHARHRVPWRAHPLAVVLDTDGSYLGYHAGLPVEGNAAGWAEAVAAIVPRARRMREVRDGLAETPDDPALLLELGTLLVAAGEYARADDVFARVERVEPIGNEKRLGEARYQRLRMRVVGLLEGKKWGDVEPLCLKWRRRFSEHGRIADVLLLQANARFLAGDGDGAREMWTRLTEEHADTDAGKHAKSCLAEYPEKAEEPPTEKPAKQPPTKKPPPKK